MPRERGSSCPCPQLLYVPDHSTVWPIRDAHANHCVSISAVPSPSSRTRWPIHPRCVGSVHAFCCWPLSQHDVLSVCVVQFRSPYLKTSSSRDHQLIMSRPWVHIVQPVSFINYYFLFVICEWKCHHHHQRAIITVTIGSAIKWTTIIGLYAKSKSAVQKTINWTIESAISGTANHHHLDFGLLHRIQYKVRIVILSDSSSQPPSTSHSPCPWVCSKFAIGHAFPLSVP